MSCRYDLTDSSSGASSDHVLEVFVYEAYRLFRDRLVGTEAINRFDNILATVVRSDWSANVFDSIASKLVVCHVLIYGYFPESFVN